MTARRRIGPSPTPSIPPLFLHVIRDTLVFSLFCENRPAYRSLPLFKTRQNNASYCEKTA